MVQFEIVDTHVHFWDPGALEYVWLTADQLEPEHLNADVKYGVYGHDPRENDWILEITTPLDSWHCRLVGFNHNQFGCTTFEQVQKDPKFKG